MALKVLDFSDDEQWAEYEAHEENDRRDSEARGRRVRDESKAHSEANGYAVVSAGSYDIEVACNPDTDAFDRRAIRVHCPHCDREASPLCSPHCGRVADGWQWVGLDYQEPYAKFIAKCAGCGRWYSFKTYCPQ